MNVPRDELELRPMRFRGGPVDGRVLEVPRIESREWTIPTLGGRWVGDLEGRLPADLTGHDLRFEDYLRVGDEYVHATLVATEDAPAGWLVRLGIG